MGTYGGDGVAQLNDLDGLLRVLRPDPHRPIVAPTREQAPSFSTPLHINGIDDGAVAAEPAEDLARLEVEEEEGVVGAGGDEGRVGGVGDRCGGSFRQS